MYVIGITKRIFRIEFEIILEYAIQTKQSEHFTAILLPIKIKPCDKFLMRCLVILGETL
jgi:hypothetical protein